MFFKMLKLFRKSKIHFDHLNNLNGDLSAVASGREEVFGQQFEQQCRKPITNLPNAKPKLEFFAEFNK